MSADEPPRTAGTQGVPARLRKRYDRTLLHRLTRRVIDYCVRGVWPRPTRSASPSATDHWHWRVRVAEQIAASLDPDRFGVEALYLIGSAKNATAGPASDLDLIVHVRGSPEQRAELTAWLAGWSLRLAELNYLRTGHRSSGLLDLHFVTDADIEEQTSYAAKIGAVTDPARPLPLKGTGVAAAHGSS